MHPAVSTLCTLAAPQAAPSPAGRVRACAPAGGAPARQAGSNSIHMPALQA